MTDTSARSCSAPLLDGLKPRLGAVPINRFASTPRPHSRNSNAVLVPRVCWERHSDAPPPSVWSDFNI